MNVLNGLDPQRYRDHRHDPASLFDGTQTLAGTGQVTFGPDAYDIGYNDYIYNSIQVESPSAAVSTLTIGPSLTVGGQSGEVEGTGGSPTQVVNQGTISSAGYVTIQDTALDNPGTLEANTGGTLAFDDLALSNEGTLARPAGPRVQGGVTFTNGAGGTLLMSEGGSISVSGGATIENAGETLSLDTSDGSFVLGDGGVLLGGTVTAAAPGSTITAQGGSWLDGMTLDIDLSPPGMTATCISSAT